MVLAVSVWYFLLIVPVLLFILLAFLLSRQKWEKPTSEDTPQDAE